MNNINKTQQPNTETPAEIPKAQQVKLNMNSTRKTTRKNKNALEETYESDVKFPFKWKYGHIKELTDKEKAEINRIKHRGRRQYQKPCALCGEQGNIKFRKINNGNTSLICETCANKYVLSLMRITKKGI
ncbi:MAG: hypothetical protein U9R47_07735 [Actinomycetota bacterium]|nr:hypothetical protein [Actinomycetota bacterium]